MLIIRMLDLKIHDHLCSTKQFHLYKNFILFYFAYIFKYLSEFLSNFDCFRHMFSIYFCCNLGMSLNTAFRVNLNGVLVLVGCLRYG